MSKRSVRLFRKGLPLGQPYVIPFPRCTVTNDGIHRDGKKCRTCNHHHCWLCRICARCRAKNLVKCLCCYAPDDPPLLALDRPDDGGRRVG